MKAPFPWFGGKRRVAHLVWDRFGDVPNYVEPFAGSLAVLLERPHMPRCETVNDKDCYLANFWRAIQRNPEAVAYWADWPVNEADLHARHTWLSNQAEFQEKMKTDPDYFDVNIAGWWVWGLSMWIGGGWCSASSQLKNSRDRANGDPRRGRPYLSREGQGVNVQHRVPFLTRPGKWVSSIEHWRKRPIMKRGGVGVQRVKPDLSGSAGAYGRGVHACGMESKTGGLLEYFQALSDRLRRVRVCCGDFERILGPSPTTHVGMTAVLLDPPYSESADRDPELYREECLEVAVRAREWAISNGNNPLLRIALCGYEGEHQMPADWTKIAWQTNGGYANQANDKSTKGILNRTRERIWFSPNCLQPAQNELFTHDRL